VISSLASAAGFRQPDIDDATLHMRRAAKDFQVAGGVIYYHRYFLLLFLVRLFLPRKGFN